MSVRAQEESFSVIETTGSAERPLPAILGRESNQLGDLFVRRLSDLGVETAFGIVGGGIAPMSHAFHRSRIRVVHTRHEAGAAFAAVEASLASGRPTVVFTTTGPGITNALTGLHVARCEGATVILVSGATAAPVRDRWVLQESAPHALPGMYAAGPLFHYATLLEHGDQLGTVIARLARGMRRPHGFVAHVGVPTPLQTQELERPPRRPGAIELRADHPVDRDDVELVAALVREHRVVIWAGFGAREASGRLRVLAERLGAPVMTSPRGKGVFDEGHPLFLGVTGFGGHGEVQAAMAEYRPRHVLVLGTRMGELTSGWDRALVPAESFIHVDIDPDVPGLAYPDVPTIGIQAELSTFLDALLEHVPARPHGEAIAAPVGGLPRPEAATPRRLGPVRPQVLMDQLQHVVVEGSEAMVFADAGNSFAWTINRLRFDRPGRFRVNMGWGSMGHGATGPLGAVLHHADKAVTVLGDGAMLMNSEVSTAVQYGLPVVWVVLNDSQYGMVEHGMRAAGYQPVETAIPRTDFALLARAMGAQGIRVESEEELQAALEQAMAAPGPFVVDVVIDPDVCAPVASRLNQLEAQGVVHQECGG
ncbi:MAG: thiamine pyrophosphate-binding protein [Myxococcales bacterium]|nr:thiamine pyrophosphate-binding protein [Myxococcales bacterium]